MAKPESIRTIYELKETVKWSNDRKEKISSVKELAKYGSDAIPALDEIFMVTISEDIKVACIDAIRTLRQTTDVKPDIVSNVPEKAAKA